MDKETVLLRLRENGCRVTKQRQILLNIILQEECSSCKEIYYKAVQKDPSIGVATVYRMVNLLEEIGAISRKNMYRILRGADCGRENIYVVELDDKTILNLSAGEWYEVVSEVLRCCGYVNGQNAVSVAAGDCENRRM